MPRQLGLACNAADRVVLSARLLKVEFVRPA